MSYFNTGLAPRPTHFFALTQKSKQKKSRLRPLHSKNQRSKGLNRPNSPPQIAETQTRTILNRFSHLFFGSLDEVSPKEVVQKCERFLRHYIFPTTQLYNLQKTRRGNGLVFLCSLSDGFTNSISLTHQVTASLTKLLYTKVKP